MGRELSHRESKNLDSNQDIPESLCNRAGSDGEEPTPSSTPWSSGANSLTSPPAPSAKAASSSSRPAPESSVAGRRWHHSTHRQDHHQPVPGALQERFSHNGGAVPRLDAGSRRGAFYNVNCCDAGSLGGCPLTTATERLICLRHDDSFDHFCQFGLGEQQIVEPLVPLLLAEDRVLPLGGEL